MDQKKKKKLWAYNNCKEKCNKKWRKRRKKISRSFDKNLKKKRSAQRSIKECKKQKVGGIQNGQCGWVFCCGKLLNGATVFIYFFD